MPKCLRSFEYLRSVSGLRCLSALTASRSKSQIANFPRKPNCFALELLLQTPLPRARFLKSSLTYPFCSGTCPASPDALQLIVSLLSLSCSRFLQRNSHSTSR